MSASHLIAFMLSAYAQNLDGSSALPKAGAPENCSLEKGLPKAATTIGASSFTLDCAGIRTEIGEAESAEIYATADPNLAVVVMHSMEGDQLAIYDRRSKALTIKSASAGNSANVISRPRTRVSTRSAAKNVYRVWRVGGP